jgi:membrane protein involved in colicin uptake
MGDRDASAARRSGSLESGSAPGQDAAVSEWARMALSLQRSAGNQAVAAMVQRKNGKGKGGGTKAEKEAADKARRKAQQQVREASSGAAMKEKLTAGQAKREAAAAEAAKSSERAKQKAAKVREIAASWRADIGAAVDQVKALRHAKRQAGWDEDRVMRINAGTNAGAPSIPGGTNNPITFTVPRNDFGITKADVSTSIAGFDSSDSGLFKFRMADGIFIHGQ